MVSKMAGTARGLLDDSINSFMDTFSSATSSLSSYSSSSSASSSSSSSSSHHRHHDSASSSSSSSSDDHNRVTKTHTVTTTGWEERVSTSTDDKHSTHTPTTLVPATRTTVSTAVHLKSTPAVKITMSLGDELKTFTMTHSAGFTQPTAWADKVAMAHASDEEKKAWADEHDGEQKPDDDDNPLWLVTNDDETDDLSDEDIDRANSEIRKATSEAWNPTSLGLLPMTTITFTNTASTPLATSFLAASRSTTIAPKATVTAAVKDTEQCDIMDLDCFVDSVTAAPKPTSTDAKGHVQYDSVGPHSEQDNGPNLSVGAICGLAGGIFLFFLIGAVVIAWTRRRAHDRKELMPHKHRHDGVHGSWVDQGGIYGASDRQRRSYFHPAHDPQQSYTYGNVGNGVAPPVAHAAAGATSPPAGYRVLSSRFSDASGGSTDQQPRMSQSSRVPASVHQDPFSDRNAFGGGAGSSEGHGTYSSNGHSISPSYGHGRNVSNASGMTTSTAAYSNQTVPPIEDYDVMTASRAMPASAPARNVKWATASGVAPPQQSGPYTRGSLDEPRARNAAATGPSQPASGRGVMSYKSTAPFPIPPTALSQAPVAPSASHSATVAKFEAQVAAAGYTSAADNTADLLKERQRAAAHARQSRATLASIYSVASAPDGWNYDEAQQHDRPPLPPVPQQYNTSRGVHDLA